MLLILCHKNFSLMDVKRLPTLAVADKAEMKCRSETLRFDPHSTGLTAGVSRI